MGTTEGNDFIQVRKFLTIVRLFFFCIHRLSVIKTKPFGSRFHFRRQVKRGQKPNLLGLLDELSIRSIHKYREQNTVILP
jgi:hypothetical protein